MTGVYGHVLSQVEIPFVEGNCAKPLRQRSPTLETLRFVDLTGFKVANVGDPPPLRDWSALMIWETGSFS